PKTNEERLLDIKPSFAWVFEGAGSSTRKAMGIDMKPTTPAQSWVVGVSHMVDESAAVTSPATEKSPTKRNATIRELEDDHQLVDASGNLEAERLRGGGVSGGSEGTGGLVQMGRDWDGNPARPQKDINRKYIERLSLVTG